MAEEGLSFGDIFMAIRKKLKLVLLATLLLAVLFCITVEFLYNPYASSYQIGFELSYPGSDAQKYPDGSPFYYRDIISLETMQKAIGEDGRLGGVDIGKMSEEDDITITAVTKEVNGAEVETNHYILSVKSSYFSNRELATAFLYAIARYPRKSVIDKVENIHFALDKATFSKAPFRDRIDLLSSQRERILAQYDEWIELYRGSYSVSGTTLVNYRAEAEIAFSPTLRDSLIEELETNGYVPVEYLPARRAALEAEKAENEKKIAALREVLTAGGSSAVLTAAAYAAAEGNQSLDFSETLAALIVRNVQIDSQLSVLTEENILDFEQRLDAAYREMNGENGEGGIAASVSAVGKGLYDDVRVTFDSSRVVREGGLGWALNIVCGVLFGFIVSCVIACIVVLPKRKRAEQPAAQEEQPQGAQDTGAQNAEDGGGTDADTEDRS